MGSQPLSEERRFMATKHASVESQVSTFEKSASDLSEQLNIAKTNLSNANEELSSMRKNSKLPILIRSSAESKEYYLFDLNAIVRIEINGNDTALYENALDLTSVPSFCGSSTEQIVTEIMAAFTVVRNWHKPETWEELKNLFKRHYRIE